MANAVPGLEGLQAIIPPVSPVYEDITWLVTGLVLVGILLSATVTYVLMQRHSGFQARRIFSRLRSRLEKMQPAAIGEELMEVLRTALNNQNLQQNHKPESVVTISQHEWSTLLGHCDRLRFSTDQFAQRDISEAIELVQKFLRGRV